MRKTQLKGVLLLFLTAFIWGSSFVAQSIGMANVESFTFNGVRTLLGALTLLPVVLIKDIISLKKNGKPTKERFRSNTKNILIGGTVMGIALCIASNFQQFAFSYPDHSAGKIAFITAFYMFFVPLLGLLIKKRVPIITWIAVAVGTLGLYFLCVGEEGFSAITMSDILSFICAIFYAVHILVIEKFAGDNDAIKLSFTQFLVSGTLTVILMFIFETPTVEGINSSILPLLYSGIMSCGLAYTFQVIGQKYTESTVASLIMCLESVFGVLCGVIFLKEALTSREIAGCIIMFSAIIVSQFSEQIQNKLLIIKNIQEKVL